MPFLRVIAFLILITFPSTHNRIFASELMLKELASHEKGLIAELAAKEIWESAGREVLYFKLNATLDGVDLITITKEGILELHEVKGYTGWAGQNSLAMKTLPNGDVLYELSDEWIRDCTYRLQNGKNAMKEMIQLGKKLENELNAGRLARIFDEIDLNTGRHRSSIGHLSEPAFSVALIL